MNKKLNQCGEEPRTSWRSFKFNKSLLINKQGNCAIRARRALCDCKMLETWCVAISLHELRGCRGAEIVFIVTRQWKST